MRPLEGARFQFSRWELLRRYCPPKKEMDLANVVGGAKPLIDALVNAGIIYDDAPKYFECSYNQERGTENLTILRLLHASYTPTNL